MMKPNFTTQILTLLMLANFVPLQMRAASVPSGGAFAAGNGTIMTAGNAVTINQSSNRGIINWKNFSIGTNGLVTFKNGSGATLNLVNGGGISSILGSLVSTGSVYLMNSQGVVIGSTGKVNTGGDFVASSQKVSNSAFMNGGALNFQGASTAIVKNLGTIASNGGSVFLIGNAVQNAGVINAPKGTIGLGAGQSVLLKDSTSDQRVFVQAPGGDITNSGAIVAAEVELKAAGGNIYALAGNNGGQIRATGTATKNGQVWLVASGGNLNVSGEISAQNADGNGGAIETSGRSVTTSNARIATGKGGNWLLDPDDLTIDSSLATTIEGQLANGDVTEQTSAPTSSGFGDINVNSGISWASQYALTLSAYRDVNINNGVTIANYSVGNLTLRADNAATGTGTVNFNGSGHVDFSGGTGNVSILYNPTNYGNPHDYSANVLTNGSWISPNDGSVNYQLTGYMLVNNVTDLGNIASNSGGTYGLGTDIDATAALNFQSIGSFDGVLDGQGHIISNLSISSCCDTYVGLIGQNYGTIRNIGLMNELVNAPFDDYTGGLVGRNSGKIYASFVNGQINGYQAGGLVGLNEGTINNSYSAGGVNQSYGSGAAGLVFDNGGTIYGSYSTAIAGSGLVAIQEGSTTVSYWDMDNSGTSASASGVGLTRSTLQAGIPDDFNSSVWSGGGADAIYPYLLWQVPRGTTPVPISGTVYYDQSHVHSPVNNPVQGIVNGSDLGQRVYTGADGYYYFLANSSSVPPGSGLITYVPSTPNASFYDNVPSAVSLPITLNYLTLANTPASLTTAVADMNAAGGASIALQSLPFSVAAGNVLNLTSGTNLDVIARDSTNIDQALVLNSLVLETYGAMTQNAPINVTDLSLIGDGAYTLTNGGNLISVLATAPQRNVTVNQSVIIPPRPRGSVRTNTSVFSGTDLLLGTTDAATGIYVAGKATIVTSQGLTIDSGITVEADGGGQTPGLVRPNKPVAPSGIALVLSDGTTFTNNSGSSALFTPRSFWQVWSQDPADDNRGGESYAFKQYNATYGGTTPGQSTGNGFFYTLAPTLSTSFADVTKQYDATTALSIDVASFTPLTGEVDADAATLNGPTVAGTYSDKNAGTNKTINVTGLTATATALSGAAKVYGYTVNPAQNETSSITKAPLNVTASAANKVYDGTTSTTGTASVGGGIFSGDTVSISGGTYAFNDPNAGTSKTVTVSGLALTGSDAANYYTVPVPNPTASITPASLFYSPVLVSRSYGTNNPVFLGTITGFAGSDTLSSVSTGNLVFNSSATPISVASSYSILGSGITLSNGNYTLDQSAASSTALTISRLTLTVNNTSRVVGDPNMFSLSYNGSTPLAIDLSSLLSNVTFVTNPANNATPGTYQITATNSNSNLEGSLLFNPGILTVTPGAPPVLPVVPPIAPIVPVAPIRSIPPVPPVPPVWYAPPPPLNSIPLSILAGPNTTGMFEIGYSPAFDWTNFLMNSPFYNHAFASASSFLATPTSETSSSDYAAGIHP